MKYTCPKCKAKYCSLKCFKSEKHIEMDTKTAQEEPKPESPTEEPKVEQDSGDQGPTEDPMINALIKDDRFQYYMKSPQLQLHLLTIVEILNNVSLTNEYSADGRREIASKKINNLRLGGAEPNEWMNEFFEWLEEWIAKYKQNVSTQKAEEVQN